MQKAIYKSKHAFNGAPAQSQLSFVAGATIVAEMGQSGAWWWGRCNGVDGWFPPAYVTLIQQQPPPAAQQPVAVAQPPPQQRRMATPVQQQQQQQQQQNNLYGQQQTQQQQGGFGMMTSTNAFMPQQQQQQQQQQKSGFQAGTEDPFADLEPAPAPISGGGGMAQNTSVSSNSVQQQGVVSQQPPVSGGVAGGLGGMTMQQQQQQPQQPPVSGGANLLDVFKGTASASSTTATTPVVTNQKKVVGGTPPLSGGAPLTATANLNASSMPSSPSIAPMRSSSPSLAPMRSSSPAMNSVGTGGGGSIGGGGGGGGGGMSLPPPSIVTGAATALDNNNSFHSEGNRSRSGTSDSIKSARSRSDSMSRSDSIKSPLRSRSGTGDSTGPMRSRTGTGDSIKSNPSINNNNNKPPTTRPKSASSSSSLSSRGSGGLGKSGAKLDNISTTPTTSSAVASVGNARFFNIYEFLAGADKKEPTRKFYPIERVKPFWALMNIDVYVKKYREERRAAGSGSGGGSGGLASELGTSHSTDGGDKPAAFTAAPKYEQLAKALSFMCHLVQESERNMYSSGGKSHTLDYLRPNQIGCEAAIKLISMLPHSAGASGKNLDALFLNFINTFVNLVGNVQAEQQLVMPGGWQQPDRAHLCLYILRNQGGGKFTFTAVSKSWRIIAEFLFLRTNVLKAP